MMIIAAGPAVASSRMRHAEHAVIIDAIATGESATVREVMGAHMDWFAGKYVDDKSGQLADLT